MIRVLFIAIVLLTVPELNAQTIFIRDGQVFTQSSVGVIKSGDVIIRDGRIVSVGVDLKVPEGAMLIEAKDKWVTAGFVASYTHLGLDEVSLSAGANDASADKAFMLSASLDAQDAFNSSSSLIPVTRLGGVTRAIVAPQSSSGMFAGSGAAVHLGEGASLLVKRKVAMFADLSSAGASLEGSTRMGPWAVLREAMDMAKAYARDPNMPVDGHLTRSDLRALLPVAEGKLPLAAFAHRADNIARLVALKKTRGIEVIVLGASEAWRVADQLKAVDIPVVISPFDNLPENFDRLGATLENAARLHRAGVLFAIYDGSFKASHNARLIPQLAGNAVSAGLPWKAALAAVTTAPAKIWGMGNYGVIEEGASSDIVVWSGDPFETDTLAEHVIIKGKPMPIVSRQNKLRDRYKNVAR